MRHGGRTLFLKVRPWYFFCAICQMAQPECIPDFSFISLFTHFATKRSSSFARRGVREIGRISFSITFGGFRFGNGHIFAIFHFEGTCPSLMELLNIAAIGFARMVARSRSIQAAIPSGPGALFCLIFDCVRFRRQI